MVQAERLVNHSQIQGFQIILSPDAINDQESLPSLEKQGGNRLGHTFGND